MPEGPTRGVS